MMLSNSIKKKIKIRVKSKQNIYPDREELHNPASLDVFKIMNMCRENDLVVRGNKQQMCKSLLLKLYDDRVSHTKPFHNKKVVAGQFFVRYFLWKLGHLDISDAINANDIDIYTSCKISRIPKVYIFCIHKDNYLYTFDIRSLNEYYQEIGQPEIFLNPYTTEPIHSDDIVRMKRKVKWLKRFRFQTIHDIQPKNMTIEAKVNAYGVDVFQRISLYQYVDYNWFRQLNFHQVKTLYYELHDLWSYRLNMSMSEKLEIVKDGVLFANWKDTVERYTKNMLNTMRYELLRNVERLVTEGQTDTDKSQGALYFMLGFVQVSQEAADNNPQLFQAVYHDDDD